MANLQQSYSELKSTVTLLEEMTKGFAIINQQYANQAGVLDDLQNTVNALVSGKSSVSIGGDYTGQDKTGRDKNSMLVLLFLGVCLLGLGIMVFGGKLVLDQQRILIESQKQTPTVVIEEQK
jgi:hypothetical protein